MTTHQDALHTELLEVAVDAARTAGDELLRRFGSPEDVEAKNGLTDLVSAADRAAELAIDNVVSGRRLDDGVLGEEGTEPGRHERAALGRRPA